SKRSPELSDVSKRFAMQWIKSNPDCLLAVRRLYPWVHLSHGATCTDSLSASSCRTGFSTADYCVQLKPTSEAARSLNLCRSTNILPLADVKTASSWRGKSARMTKLYFVLGVGEGKKKAALQARRVSVVRAGDDVA